MTLRLRHLVDLYGEAGAREQFQKLVTRLVQSEHADAKEMRLRRGDGGVDTFVGRFGGDVSVWQSKFLLPPIDEGKRRQIRDSFKTAKDNPRFNLIEWTVVLPCDLDQDEQAWFDEWRSNQDGVTITHWPEATLLPLLHHGKNEHVRNEFFQEDTRLRLKAIYDRLVGQQVAVPWDAVREALLREFDHVAAVARVLASQKVSIDGVSPHVFKVPVWGGFRSEIEARLRGRRWWADLTELYDVWSDLARIAPSIDAVFGGPEAGARAIGRMLACVPIAGRVLEVLETVWPLVANEVDIEN